jgi:hypothetical protein
VGVVTHADSSANSATPTGAFAELHRSAPGDPRDSSANALTDEFLGDYVYAVAARIYGAAVWNDLRSRAASTRCVVDDVDVGAVRRDRRCCVEAAVAGRRRRRSIR